ncbi:alpha/beta hydrolase [Nitratireductor sp. GCM10026969]|uniref:alpha/beta hydrolase n=1 Tax=Nitratireductor sp. GCM10026969 TaxID=3252645 RepID=UPI003618DEC1
MTHVWIVRFWNSFSAAGLFVGTLFFAASLTPSLLPRTFLTQGILSGAALAAGYGIGVFSRWLAHYMELPGPNARVLCAVKYLSAVLCAGIAVAFLWQAAEWQNSIRRLMGMELLDSAHPLRTGLIAAVTFILLLAVARLFRLLFTFTSAWLRRYIPPPVANVVGVAVAVALFWVAVEGVLFRFALRAADTSFQAYDALMEPETEQPADLLKTGSAASLVAWEDLGRAGREFVASGPSAGELEAFRGEPAMEPIRVYVGLNAAETPEARAGIALAELERTGAFERSVLVIVTPTGTGWVDPAAMDTLEYLHGGNVASVAVQYSYLTSWLSLLVEPDYGTQTARALFSAVYGHWRELPEDERPRLYLHGLSLGSLGSEASTEFFEVLGDPYHGALWSGPPFANRMWQYVTSRREPSTPEWLPRFRDGSFVRFTNQTNALEIPGAHWGPLRIVYLQYASDPVTFFDYHALYRQPDWMKRPRGPDVSPELRWYPVVTFLQLALDMALAITAPMGHGHVYAPEHYIDAWMAVTAPQGVSAEEADRLKQRFARE